MAKSESWKGVVSRTISETAKYNGPPYSSFAGATSSGESWNNVKSTGDSPKAWRTLIATGGCATSLLQFSGEERSATGGYAFINIPYFKPDPPTGYPGQFGIFADAQGEIVSFPSGNTSFETSTTRARNQALTRLYADVNAVNTKFQGLVFSGELRESLRMIKNPAAALRKGVGDYLNYVKKRGPAVSPRKRAKWVSGTWLEYSYGWKPLINDIDSGIKAFYGSKQVRPLFERVRGRGSDRSATMLGTGTWSSSFSGALVARWERQRKEKSEYKYYGVVSSSGNGTSDVHKYGFNPASFVPAVWELIPYSFLVDYFTNIGDVISSWSYRFIGLDWCSLTVYREISFETLGEQVAPSFNPGLTGQTAGGNIGSARRRIVSINRQPNVDPGLPTLEFQCPGFGSSKWLNLSALAVSNKAALKALRID